MAKHGSFKEAWAPAETLKASENRPDFASSIRTIVLCLKFFGFAVNWGDQRPAKCRLISRLYRFMWLLTNVVAVSTSTCYAFTLMATYDGSRSMINISIITATATVQIAASYASLALAAWKDGGQLAESLRKIETRMPICKEVLKKIKIASITAVATATIMVGMI